VDVQHRAQRGGERVAVLARAGEFDALRRWDDLFEEGVAAVFGIRRGEAELLALCFEADRFTLAEATGWLAERGLRPLDLRDGSAGRWAPGPR
jgi:hypothetical protein